MTGTAVLASAAEAHSSFDFGSLVLVAIILGLVAGAFLALIFGDPEEFFYGAAMGFFLAMIFGMLFSAIDETPTAKEITKACGTYDSAAAQTYQNCVHGYINGQGRPDPGTTGKNETFNSIAKAWGTTPDALTVNWPDHVRPANDEVLPSGLQVKFF